MPDIVISEFMDAAAIEDLSADYDVLYDPALVDRPEDLASSLTEARALIVRNRTQVRGPLLEAAPALRVVGRLGVGLDNIDLGACRDRNIEVCPATGANNVSVAEYVITAIAALLRGAYFAREAMLAGTWPRSALMGGELQGRQLGLLGFGAIARETADRALALGMTVVAHDPFVDPADPAWGRVQSLEKDALIERSDAISLHVPLNDATRHMIDAAALSAMKPEAVLVNAARGGVVDESALAEALKSGRIAGAALDVFETEPLTAEAAQKFRDIGNLILTPHIAGVTVESNVRVSAVTAENVRRVLERTP